MPAQRIPDNPQSSTLKRRPSPPHQETPTTISALPTELLDLVFEECYLDFLREKECEPDLANPPWFNGFEGLALTPSLKSCSRVDRLKPYKSPSRFPYSLASVSRFWMELLSTRPEYWQEAILCYDPRLWTLRNWASYLSWSRDLLIDVVIVVQDLEDLSTLSAVEYKYVERVMDILRPHIFRCRSLNVETYFSSAIPLIDRHIHIIPLLSSLSLTSKFLDTDWHDPSEEALSDPYSPCHYFSTPALKSLEVEGYNLRTVFPIFLSQQSNLRNLQHLAIFNHTRSSYKPTLVQVLQLIEDLPDLLRLKFVNTEFRTTFNVLAHFSLGIRELYLEDVTLQFIENLFSLCDFDEIDHITFTRCLIDDIPSCDMLTLEDVRTTKELTTMLRSWEGSRLWIRSCQMFSDKFFDMLRTFEWESETFDCPWLECLFLRDLPLVSLKKLKKMINRRNNYIQYDDPDWKSNTDFGPGIRTLYIQNCGITDLTDEDIKWFSSRLVEFTYVK